MGGVVQVLRLKDRHIFWRVLQFDEIRSIWSENSAIELYSNWSYVFLYFPDDDWILVES